MWAVVMKTSEFWVGLVGVNLVFLASLGLVPEFAVEPVKQVVKFAVEYVLARLSVKAIRAVAAAKAAANG